MRCGKSIRPEVNGEEMEEIGGYIELDEFKGEEYHSKAFALNCGRNCLAYLIETKKIQKIYMPYFICSSVANVCYKYGVQVEYYHIDEKFQPILDLDVGKKEFVYMINYYGQLSDEAIKRFKAQWKNIIIDHSQDFFRMPVQNVDTLYSCRKFFGVCDGAYLYTDCKTNLELENDVSFERLHYVLGRYEKNASEFYDEASKNNIFFEKEPIKRMSKLTHNILKIIDYDGINNIRTINYNYLFERLNSINQLQLDLVSGAFAYPILLKNGGGIRRQLIEQKIYVPLLWPNVLQEMQEDTLEYRYAKNILPLPCDQRYGLKEMEIICNMIYKMKGTI